jgi:acyl-CoA thioesterase FadM
LGLQGAAKVTAGRGRGEAGMYPFVRMWAEVARVRRLPPIGLWDWHVSHHRCLPWDLDMWAELNNGRTLTLYDLGRIPMGWRTGMFEVMKAQRWGIAVAGASVRYRKRIRLFERVEMRTRCIGWDRRFLYMEQSLWKGGECANHLLIRSAITSGAGIVDPGRLIGALGLGDASPPLPDWAAAWVEAEAQRPWPPAR